MSAAGRSTVHGANIVPAEVPLTHRILLVEDELPMCEALQELLGSHGYEVTYATGGADALAVAGGVDLTICDLRLGTENGLQVIRQLRGARPDLKIVVLTANPSIKALQAAKDLGVLNFLTKPVKPPELVTTITRALDEEIGPVLLFPSSLRTRLPGLLPYVPEVMVADAPKWLRARTLVRSTTAVIVDASAAETLEFLDTCRPELEGTALFLYCREEDFETARHVIAWFPSARCLDVDSGVPDLLRAIRERVTARRAESAEARAALAQQLRRCKYAEPLRLGYYCTLSGACPFGEEKHTVTTVRGRDYHQCPKRPFVITAAERVGVVTWPPEAGDSDPDGLSTRILEQVQAGKRHVLVNCQALEALPTKIVAVLTEVENTIGEDAAVQIDFINLSTRLLAALHRPAELLVKTKFHGRVIVETDGVRQERF
jgi:CheY-like chemotaxis protein